MFVNMHNQGVGVLFWGGAFSQKTVSKVLIKGPINAGGGAIFQIIFAEGLNSLQVSAT